MLKLGYKWGMMCVGPIFSIDKARIVDRKVCEISMFKDIVGTLILVTCVLVLLGRGISPYPCCYFFLFSLSFHLF